MLYLDGGIFSSSVYSVFQFLNNGKKEISTGKCYAFGYFVSPKLPQTVAEEGCLQQGRGEWGRRRPVLATSSSPGTAATSGGALVPTFFGLFVVFDAADPPAPS